MFANSFSCIIAQCYDGASVMSGRVNGVQAQIRESHMTDVDAKSLSEAILLSLQSLGLGTCVGFVAATVSVSVTVGGCRAIRPVVSLFPAVVADVAVL